MSEPSEPERSTTGMPTQEQIDSHRGYRVTKWRTFDNFECLKCQYATLWLEKMLKHLQLGDHPWAFPSETPLLSEQLDEPLEY